MRGMRRAGVVIGLLTGIGMAGLALATAQPAGEGQAARAEPVEKPMAVVVSIPPLRGLVEPLLPPGSTVEVLIPPGVSEHGYEIPPSRLAAMARADLVVYVGLGLEPQVERFVAGNTSDRRTDVCVATALNLQPDAHHDHDHDHDGHDHADHAHAHAVDPHVWLDPVRMRALAKSLHDTLAASSGGAENAALRERFAALDLRLARTEARYAEALAAPKRPIVVAHDAYGWLAKRYNLEIVPIAGLSAAEPTPSAIAAAARAVKERGVKVVCVEPQLNQSAARRLADATGATVMVLDPLGDGDWFALMDRNLETLKAALTASPAPPPQDAKP